MFYWAIKTTVRQKNVTQVWKPGKDQICKLASCSDIPHYNTSPLFPLPFFLHLIATTQNFSTQLNLLPAKPPPHTNQVLQQGQTLQPSKTAEYLFSVVANQKCGNGDMLIITGQYMLKWSVFIGVSVIILTQWLKSQSSRDSNIGSWMPDCSRICLSHAGLYRPHGSPYQIIFIPAD